jgi:hypothetical protein
MMETHALIMTLVVIAPALEQASIAMTITPAQAVVVALMSAVSNTQWKVLVTMEISAL